MKKNCRVSALTSHLSAARDCATASAAAAVQVLSATTTASTESGTGRVGTPISCTVRMPWRTSVFARSVAPVRSSAIAPSSSVMFRLLRLCASDPYCARPPSSSSTWIWMISSKELSARNPKPRARRASKARGQPSTILMMAGSGSLRMSRTALSPATRRSAWICSATVAENPGIVSARRAPIAVTSWSPHGP